MRLTWSTVNSVLSVFAANGYSLDYFERRSRRFREIDSRILDYLRDRHTLQQWAAFSLNERVEIIRRVFRVQISKTSLLRFYSMNGITYTAGKQVYRAYLLRQPHLEMEQRQFALLLGNLIKKKVPLIYMDESSCNSFSVKHKSWSLKECVNVHHRDNKRFSVTIYGAISEAL